MRILVTGADGFIGRAVASVLAEQRYELTLTDLNCHGPDAAGKARLVSGDIQLAEVRRAALEDADAVIHLATIPGGAAEGDPDLARRINVDATMELSSELAVSCPGAPFVFASSIAVLGHPLPPSVDDDTPLAPMMLYGAHKAMTEAWLATLSRRGDLAGISLRLPGIIARPSGPSGMKSAFISDVFHAIAAGRSIELPVSPEATMWLMSVRQVAQCLVQALGVAHAELPVGRAMTLPALRVRMDELVTEICRQSSGSESLVSYNLDTTLEQGFGRQPPLATALADTLGFTHDGNLEALVQSALQSLK